MLLHAPNARLYWRRLARNGAGLRFRTDRDCEPNDLVRRKGSVCHQKRASATDVESFREVYKVQPAPVNPTQEQRYLHMDPLRSPSVFWLWLCASHGK